MVETVQRLWVGRKRKNKVRRGEKRKIRSRERTGWLCVMRMFRKVEKGRGGSRGLILGMMGDVGVDHQITTHTHTHCDSII